MLERDEQHLNHNRFAEVCTSVLDGFCRHGAPARGTMVLLHLRRSTAIHQHRDAKEGELMREIASLCMKRRFAQPGEFGPLVVCMVSRTKVLNDGKILTMAK